MDPSELAPAEWPAGHWLHALEEDCRIPAPPPLKDELSCMLPHIPFLHNPGIMYHRPKARGPHTPEGLKLLSVTVAES